MILVLDCREIDRINEWNPRLPDRAAQAEFDPSYPITVLAQTAAEARIWVRESLIRFARRRQQVE